MKKLACLLVISSACAAVEDDGNVDGALPAGDASGLPDASRPPGDAGFSLDAQVPQPTRDAGGSPTDAAVRDASSAPDSATPRIDGGPSDAGPSACTTPAGPSGSRVIQVDGRSVTIYIPPSLGATTSAPVLFSLHGFGIDPGAMPALTNIPKLADEQGLIGVFPAGDLGSWNTGASSCGLGSLIGTGGDDAKYLENVLTAVAAQHCIDRSRVFVSGFSMGGYSANYLACTRPDLVRAAAAHSGGAPTVMCKDAKVPVLVLHGTNDGTISYDCGTAAEKLWVEHDACSSSPADIETVAVKGGSCVYHRKCGDGSQVGLCSFMGMGHGWAGSGDLLAGGGTNYEDATQLMWKFFAQYR